MGGNSKFSKGANSVATSYKPHETDPDRAITLIVDLSVLVYKYKRSLAQAFFTIVNESSLSTPSASEAIETISSRIAADITRLAPTNTTKIILAVDGDPPSSKAETIWQREKKANKQGFPYPLRP